MGEIVAKNEENETNKPNPYLVHSFYSLDRTQIVKTLWKEWICE